MISKSQVIVFLFLVHVIAGLTAHAESSFELSCRNKAKEIAAETYKNCVTEQRESQLQQIRSEYKDKLSELKSHYDKELKKLSSKTAEGPALQTKTPSAAASKQHVSSKNTRTSGTRSLPKKSVKTEVIDFTTPSVESNPEENMVQSQNRLKSDTDSMPDVEIVELPTQE
jgi:hypothetical protein